MTMKTDRMGTNLCACCGQGWISVEDRLPEFPDPEMFDRVMVVVDYVNEMAIPFRREAYYENDQWWFAHKPEAESAIPASMVVTHWQHLPDLPGGAQWADQRAERIGKHFRIKDVN